MASENAEIDNNNKPVAMAVTDDSNLYRKMFRIDDTTKGLKVMLVGGAGAGTITSITAGTGLTATVANPIVASGTIALDSKLAPLDTLGTALQSIRVNAGATALEYYTPAGGLSGSGNTNEIAYFTAGTVLGSLAVATYPNLTELSYVKGVTSGIQAQINAKGAGTVTGSGTTNELSYWTSSTAQGTLTVATYPSLTEISYVKGVTSAIQTQINGKQASGTYAGLTANTFTGLQTFVPTAQHRQTVSAQAFDGSTGNMFTRTLAGDETFTQSNFTTGQNFIVEVTQGSGTSYTITWWSGITWITSGGTAPAMTAVSTGKTVYGFTCTGSNTFLGYLVGTQ